MKFTFIAVNYNGFKYTKEYIMNINELVIDNDDKIEIIIVDNQSSKDDYDALYSFCNSISNVKLIQATHNLGYFKGLNEGIIHTSKDDNTLLIIGNNDITFNQDFIKNLKNITYDEKVLVLAPNIITKEGKQQNPHVVDKVSTFDKIKSRIYFSNYYIGQILRLLYRSIKLFKRKSVTTNNNYRQMVIRRGIGACYILTPLFFNFFDTLDDRVFMWGEEALLSNQLESVGGLTLYDPTIIITHHESASVKSIQSKKKYQMVRESYKIYWRYL